MNTGAMAEAFELLQAEVDAEVGQINEEGSAAFAAGEHERAKAALERAKELKALQQRLEELEAGFARLLRPAEADSAKLPRGLKTPQAAYRLPILRALLALGGQGSIDAVLERVQAALKDRLNEYDLAPMPSDENIPRWRNTAQWARNNLRAEGLLKADSPRGIWELTDEGRRAAEEMG